MIKYIGSKRTLVSRIVDTVKALPDVRTVCDLFTGTTRVAQGFKTAGFQVIANDTATYSEALALCYIEQDGSALNRRTIADKLAHLAALPPAEGYFTETFCVRSRYFQPKNGARIDAIRPEIDRIADTPIERAILLVSLMEAADRVDSTTGLQMAYLKQWAARSFNDLELRVPVIPAGTGIAVRRDALEFAAEVDTADACYIDPPYNQHSYFSNYHIWETLVRWDSPEVYGIACKRLDCRENKSPFNSKKHAWQALAQVIRSVRSPYVVLSFNNEGFFTEAQISELLQERGEDVVCISSDFKRYVGAQIGIHNLKGEKVGRISHLRNREFLFVSGPDAASILSDGAGGDEQLRLLA